MKIIQLNTWEGRLIDLVSEFIEAEKPDILCAQEVYNTNIALSPQSEKYQVLNTLRKAGGFEFVIHSPTWSATVFGQKIDFGNAIFSHLPIFDYHTVFIDGEYQLNPEAGDLLPNVRNLIITKVKSDSGKDFSVATHHGFYHTQPMGNKENIKSVKAVADELLKIRGPLVFCGDLNVVKESPAFAPLTKLDLRNLTDEYDIETTLTELHESDHRSSTACDYILCSQDIKVKKFHASKKPISDHRALILEFAI